MIKQKARNFKKKTQSERKS